MDWTQIIVSLLSALIPTGGVLGIFTIREKKTQMMLENANRINEQWAAFSTKEEERIKELKEDADKKDDKIDELRKEINKLNKELDVAHTEAATAKIIICDKLGCLKRRPPFGSAFSPSVTTTENDLSDEERLVNEQ